jgi:mRNA interferase MazF
MVRGEIWWAVTPGGDRPVLILTRDPVADRIGSVVVALCTRTVRGVLSELPLGGSDGMPDQCVVTFDNLHTIDRKNFGDRITQLSVDRMDDVCKTLARSLGCV